MKSPYGPAGLEHTTQNDYLRQQLQNVRYEYDRLFKYYQSETEEKLKLQENEVIQIKNLRTENRKLGHGILIHRSPSLLGWGEGEGRGL